MTVMEYLRMVARRWVWAALGYALTLGCMFAVTEYTPKLYSSRAEVLFSVSGGVSASELSQGAGYAERQMASYKTLVASRVVLVPAIKESRQMVTLDQVADNIRADVIPGTTIMAVEVLDTDPERSATLTNSVARVLSRTAESLSPQLQSGQRLIKSSILIGATPSAAPAIPNARRNSIFGHVAALAVAFLFAVIADRVDPRFKSLIDVRRLNMAPLFPALPENEGTGSTTSLNQHDRAFREALRRLQARLRVALPGNSAVCIVTSAKDGDGKTTVAVALARALAKSGLRVLLVSDESSSLPAMPGFASVDRLALLPSPTRPEDIRSLQSVSNSRRPDDSSVFIEGGKPGAFISETSQEYDLVIIDSPSLLVEPEAVLLATQTDGVLFIVDMKTGRRKEVFAGVNMLKTARVPILGVVPNRAKVGS